MILFYRFMNLKKKTKTSISISRFPSQTSGVSRPVPFFMFLSPLKRPLLDTVSEDQTTPGFLASLYYYRAVLLPADALRPAFIVLIKIFNKVVCFWEYLEAHSTNACSLESFPSLVSLTRVCTETVNLPNERCQCAQG